ncbi:hypothetical protein WJX81_005023 [Elliptochloris bilobata]|uniref:methylated diphthine methylhydrolase n=1 Tax=Elliptochloris bilobata TaxID=381761 RepID=A0AAW1RK09_9CHLO
MARQGQGPPIPQASAETHKIWAMELAERVQRRVERTSKRSEWASRLEAAALQPVAAGDAGGGVAKKHKAKKEKHKKHKSKKQRHHKAKKRQHASSDSSKDEEGAKKYKHAKKRKRHKDTSSSSSDKSAGHSGTDAQKEEDALQPARALFEERKYAGSLLLLDAALHASPSLPGVLPQQLQTQIRVCTIHLQAERGDWWQVLGLEKHSGEAVVRRQFRRLAQQVHPDKCRCFGAESAFRLISKAASIVTGHAGSAAGGADEAERDSGPKWWEAWDEPQEEAARKRQRSAPADAEAAQRSEDQLRELHALPMQGLQQEVARRQMAVLDRTAASSGLPQTMHERQASLREARSVLSQRLQAEGVAPAVPSQPPPYDGGGFFRVELAILDCAGIFDASWFSAASQQALALALSTGSVQLVLVQTHNEDHCWLESQAAVTVTRTAMVLSLDIRDGDGACMGASTSAGDLAIIEVREGGWHISRAWSAHSLEAWTCAFDRHNANVLYSGADDSTFRGWDLRCEASALFMDRKAHAAGVCCIQSSPHHEHIVCTGSYDERARLWDTRHISRPLLTAEVCTGGGQLSDLRPEERYTRAAAAVVAAPAVQPLLVAVYLDERSRAEVQQRAPPRFAKVSADHVTLAYKPSVADVARCWAAHLGSIVELTVLGQVESDSIQALVVRLPEWLAPSSSLAPHVTISIAPWASAKQAGDVCLMALGKGARVVSWAGGLLCGRVGRFMGLDDGIAEALLKQFGGDVAKAADFLEQCAPVPLSGSGGESASGAASGAESGAEALSPPRASGGKLPPAPPPQLLPTPADAFASPKPPIPDGAHSPGEASASEGAADADMEAVTAGVRLQAARLAHQQEQANYERRLATDHLQQRRVLKHAATAALAAGEGDVGRQLLHEARKHEELAADARRRANATAYGAFNQFLNRFKLDLHGQQLEEALAKLEAHLTRLGELCHPGGVLLQVVTGVGKRSVGGIPVLRPAVTKFLGSAGLRYEVDPNNRGVVNVLLGGSDEAMPSS